MRLKGTQNRQEKSFTIEIQSIALENKFFSSIENNSA